MIAVFLLATYGEGEPTDNCIVFNRFCAAAETKRGADDTTLRYAIFGLGNSCYQLYNEMAKRVNSALVGIVAQ
jgi:NADPH-ferrihemoprotein reductase